MPRRQRPVRRPRGMPGGFIDAGPGRPNRRRCRRRQDSGLGSGADGCGHRACRQSGKRAARSTIDDGKPLHARPRGTLRAAGQSPRSARLHVFRFDDRRSQGLRRIVPAATRNRRRHSTSWDSRSRSLHSPTNLIRLDSSFIRSSRRRWRLSERTTSIRSRFSVWS